MRIAIFTNNYLPNPYGVAMSIESFRKEFEKLGHVVYIFAPKTKGYENTNPHVFFYPAIDLKFKNIRYPIAIPFSFAMNKILDDLEIDIIHAQHPNLLGSAAKKWAKKKSVPLVFTWHTLYDKYAHFAPIIPNAWAAKWAINNAAKYANACDQIIVPTKSVVKIIQDWGVRNENIVDIPSGVEGKDFENASEAEVRKKYDIAENETVAFIIGRLTAEKNVVFLMRAMAIALKQKTDLKFLVGGEGQDLSLMKKIVAENKLENQVIFTGLISKEKRKEYFAAADFFVYASASETQGMILTEAHYAGLPIVAASATGAKDIVKNGETGFLVSENEEEFAEKVIKLAEDAALRQKFGENAQKIAKENYTSSVCAQKLLAVYEENIKRENKN